MKASRNHEIQKLIELYFIRDVFNKGNPSNQTVGSPEKEYTINFTKVFTISIVVIIISKFFQVDLHRLSISYHFILEN